MGGGDTRKMGWFGDSKSHNLQSVSSRVLTECARGHESLFRRGGAGGEGFRVQGEGCLDRCCGSLKADKGERRKRETGRVRKRARESGGKGKEVGGGREGRETCALLGRGALRIGGWTRGASTACWGLGRALSPDFAMDSRPTLSLCSGCPTCYQ